MYLRTHDDTPNYLDLPPPSPQNPPPPAAPHTRAHTHSHPPNASTGLYHDVIDDHRHHTTVNHWQSLTHRARLCLINRLIE